MRKDEIRQRVGDMVRETVRENEMTDSASVLGCVPDLIDSVSIDVRTILHCVDNELNRKTANPLNALLGLFGLRIVHTRSAINDLNAEFGGDMVTLEVADSGKLGSFLYINEGQLKSAMNKMTKELKQTESEQKSLQQSLREQAATLHKEMDKVSGQLSQANTDLNYQRNAVAERAQYMLSLAGKSPADPLMRDQIMELLADLELKACWSADDTGLKDATMFSELKCDEPEKRKGKPCIMDKDQVLLKGVRFVTDTAENEGPSGEV